MRSVSILVVEDDEATRVLLRSSLEEGGHIVRTVGNMDDGLKELGVRNTDLVVLDRGLPDGDGLRMCLTMRKDSRLKHIPVLMLTGRSEPCERVLGLRLGADDYLPKPFEMEEFLARVDALIRRSMPELTSPAQVLSGGGIELSIPGRSVSVSGTPVRLGGIEFDLLRILLERANTALAREFLHEAVWGKPFPGERVLDVTVKNLRRKLGAAGDRIVTVYGFGYKLQAKDAESKRK